MAERNFQEELDRVIEQFERDSETLEQVWDALRAWGSEPIDVDANELVELEETCSAEPQVRTAPQLLTSATRC